MREILFRGKRVDTGEWVYGDLLHNADAIKIREQEPDIKRIAKSYEVIPESVGQYTGLTDKNGKKIFEGDIIKKYERSISDPLNLYPTEKAKIAWNNCFSEFRADIIDVFQEKENLGEFLQGGQSEVIGNIHDNFELLEVE